MTYQSELKGHLARYKAEILGVEAHGIFLGDGKERTHILPLEQERLNLLEPTRTYVRDYLSVHPAVILHRDFHHLNSSQAFAFNLFFPFFTNRGPESALLLRALGQSGVVDTWQPEAIPDPIEKTNVDVVWTTSLGAKTFCEVKLSEDKFGLTDGDVRHSKKREEIYLPKLQGYVEPALLLADAFFANYQLLRNLWHIVGEERSFLIFLLPRANGPLWHQAEQFWSKVMDPLRARVSVLAIEDVLAKIVGDSVCPDPLREIVRVIQRKYVV